MVAPDEPAVKPHPERILLSFGKLDADGLPEVYEKTSVSS